MRWQCLLLLLGTGRAQDIVRHSTTEYRPARTAPDRPAGFGGVAPGLTLSVLAGAALWYNEGRAERESRLLGRVLRHVVRLDSSQPLDPAHDGALVHMSGRLQTAGARDPDFAALRRPDALHLRRLTEVYEWQEERTDTETRISPTEVKKEVTYRYRPSWSDRHSDASRFEVSSGHPNPHPLLPPGLQAAIVTDAVLPCGLGVPSELLRQLDDFDPVRLSGAALEQPGHLPPASVVDAGEAVYLRREEAGDTGGGDDMVGLSAGERREALTRLPADASRAAPLRTTADVQRGNPRGESGWNIMGEGGRRLNTGGEGRSLRGGRGVAGWADGTGTTLPVLARAPPPSVGDARVRWQEVRSPAEGVSILATQRGTREAMAVPEKEDAEGDARFSPLGSSPTLLPWGDGSGHFVFRLVRGAVSAEAMVEELRGEERRRRWLVRGLGWAGMAVGFRMVLRAIDAVAALIPFGIGSLLSSLTSVVGTVLAIGASAGVSALIIAAAWLRFRPAAAAALVAAAAAASYVAPVLLRGRGGRQQPQPQRRPLRQRV